MIIVVITIACHPSTPFPPKECVPIKRGAKNLVEHAVDVTFVCTDTKGKRSEGGAQRVDFGQTFLR